MGEAVSREQLERDARTARALYAAWNEHGIDAMVADFWDPDIVWDDAPDFPDSSTHQGRDAVAELLRRTVAIVGHFRLTVVDITLAAGVLVAELSLEGRGGASDIPVSTPLWHVLEFRDDRVVRCQVFLDAERAARAAGVDGDIARAHALYAAFNKGGVDAMVADFWDPEIEWQSPELPDSATYRGHDAVAPMVREMMAALGSPSVEVVEIERCSSTLLVKLAMDAQGGSSGVPMAMHTWHVLEFRGDRVIHVQAFVDGDRARAAAA